MIIKILMIGDAVRSPGTDYLAVGKLLSRKARELGADLTIVNGENSADGNGMTRESAAALFDAGADVITGGNHTHLRSEVYGALDDDPRLLRPANLPGDAPGIGYGVFDAGDAKVLVVNLLGQIFMDPADSPFGTLARILSRAEGTFDVAVVDFHAEATSEKLALARAFDGKVSVVAGTHTHIPTADCSVLPGGTGYITDLGMTGSHAGILGVKSESIIRKLVRRLPSKFEGAVGDERAEGAVFEIDTSTGRCLTAESVVF